MAGFWTLLDCKGEWAEEEKDAEELVGVDHRNPAVTWQKPVSKSGKKKEQF